MNIAFVLLLLVGAEEWKSTKDSSGNVTAMDLTSTWTTDADLARVAQYKHLRRLSLAHTKITDLGFEYLKPLENVVELDCYYCEYVTEDGIRQIRGWKKLESLNLRGSKVTSKVFELLAELTSLRSLDIAHTQIDDDGVELLATLPKLERLAIGGNRITGVAITALKSAPVLVDLDIGGIQRVDSGLWGLPLSEDNLARLAELKQLKSLSLNGATLNDRGLDRPGHAETFRSQVRDLSKLATLENLEKLDLCRLPIKPETLRPLTRLKKLRELRIGGVGVTIDQSFDSVLAELKIAHLYVVGRGAAVLSTGTIRRGEP